MTRDPFLPMTARERKLKAALEQLLAAYGPPHLPSDPLHFPRRYPGLADREVVALLCALFAYGNVKAMGAFLGDLLGRLGAHPARALLRGVSPSGWPAYRFQDGEDVGALLGGIGALLGGSGTLEARFGPDPPGVAERLERFCSGLRGLCGRPTRGLLHLLPLPSSGSACKRWWLFLRWVSRPDDGLDLGLWSRVSPAQLLLPVDTHVARVARALGLAARSTPDWKFAEEATASLRRLCPEDPVRYDFALVRPGILGLCPCGSRDPRCPLRPLCGNAGRRGG